MLRKRMAVYFGWRVPRARRNGVRGGQEVRKCWIIIRECNFDFFFLMVVERGFKVRVICISQTSTQEAVSYTKRAEDPLD